MDLKISNLFSQNKAQYSNKQSQPLLFVAQDKYSPLTPLKQDVVSFKGVKKHSGNTQKVKKTDFNGLDYAVVEKFKVNISGYSSTDDLQKWAEAKIEKDFKNKVFEGRQVETTDERKIILDDWLDYITQGNSAYTPSIQLLILDAITKDIKKDNDTLPPRLNKGVLADTIYELSERLNKNPKENINLNKIYRTKLKARYYGIDGTNNNNADFTGWIAIPSKEHDPKNFKENVDKLKELSHPNWCTKSFNAEPYLSNGDFHVYIEKGLPKIGIRFIGDEIEEIQGQRNNSQIPQFYLDKVQDYIQENDYALRDTAIDEIAKAIDLKEDYEAIKSKIGEEALKCNDAEKILPAFGIKVKKDEDGLLIIDKYSPVSWDYGFEDFGIDENALFSKIKEIKGNADFKNSSLTKFNELKTIGGNARFGGSRIKSLGSINTIKGHLLIEDSYINDLGDLEFIGKGVNFDESSVTSTGKLYFIGGDARFGNSMIESLGEIEEVGGNLSLSGSDVKDLGKLKRIGGCANFEYAQIESLGGLTSIGYTADFRNSRIKDMGELEYIGGDADFSYSDISSPGKLKDVLGNLILDEDISYEWDCWKEKQKFDRDDYLDFDIDADEIDEFERLLYQ